MNEQEQDTIEDQSTLCDRCRNISVEAIWDVDGYIIQPDIQSLVAASEYCRFCAIVKLQIWNAIKTISKLGSPGMSTEVSLCKHEDQDKVWIRIFEQPWRLKLGVLQFYKTSNATQTKEYGLLPPAHPSLENTAFLILADTLKDCMSCRGNCGNVGECEESIPALVPPLLPKRVLDVDPAYTPGDVSCVRLHEASDGERDWYLALSHRWGKAIACKTTTSNLNSRLGHIQTGDLPQTFQDAITVAKKSGIKYLWIDALCICQDDLDDWLEHAPLMGSIFQNAVCTVVAHSARYSEEGFASGTDCKTVVAIRSRTANTILVYLGLSRDYERAILGSSLTTRGWIQQEFILSARLLHCFSGTAYWECPHSATVVPLPFHTRPPPSRVHPNSRSLLLEPTEESWMQFIVHYSMCELTFEQDRLFAIEGLASLWTERLNLEKTPEYRFGHFLHDSGGLLWAATTQSDTERADVPSWSWTKAQRPIQCMGVAPMSIVGRPDTNLQSLSSATDVEILGTNAVGSRAGFELVLRGQTRVLHVWDPVTVPNSGLWPVWPDERPIEQTQQPRGGHQVVEQDSPAALLYFDNTSTADKVRYNHEENADNSAHPFLCVKIRTFYQRWDIRGDDDFGRLRSAAFGVLLLRAGDSTLSFYERVGIGLILDGQWFDRSSLDGGDSTQTLHIR